MKEPGDHGIALPTLLAILQSLPPNAAKVVPNQVRNLAVLDVDDNFIGYIDCFTDKFEPT